MIRDTSYPEVVTAYSILTSEVDLCSVCNGIGSTESRTTGTNVRYRCGSCKGDGRVVRFRKYLQINHIEEVDEQPFVDIPEDQRNLAESQWIRYIIDHRDTYLEIKYPELAAMSYDRYKELLADLKNIEKMKKT